MRTDLTDGERKERIRQGLCVSCGESLKNTAERGKHFVKDSPRGGGTYACTGERYDPPPTPVEQREALREQWLADFAATAAEGLWTFGDHSRTFTRNEALALIMAAKLAGREPSPDLADTEPLWSVLLMILQLSDRVDALENQGLGGVLGGLFGGL